MLGWLCPSGFHTNKSTIDHKIQPVITVTNIEQIAHWFENLFKYFAPPTKAVAINCLVIKNHKAPNYWHHHLHLFSRSFFWEAKVSV